MRKTMAAMAILTVLAAGCGAMFADNMHPVLVSSTQPGAPVAVDGRPVGVTPVTVVVTNHQQHVIQAGQSTCLLVPSIGPVWVVLDILAFPIGVIVDAVTGDWSVIQQTACYVP